MEIFMPKILLLLLLPLALLSGPAQATYVVSLGTGAMSSNEQEFFEATKNYLEQKFGTNEIQFMQPVSLTHLKKLIEEKKIEYFISSAGFARSLSQDGVRELLIYAPTKKGTDRNELGSVFLTRQEMTVRTLADLKGKRFTSNNPEAFFSHIVPLAEISYAGYDPKKFFSSVSFLNKNPEDLLQALIDGRTDVVALPGCYWETLSAQNKEIREKVKPVLVSSTSPCTSSTRTFPNWTLSSTKNSDAAFTRKLVTALLEMPFSKGTASWSVQMDLSSIDGLFKELKIGHFSDYRPWTLKEMLQKYSFAVLLFAVFLLGLLSLTLFLYLKLKRRSEQLVATLRAKIKTDRAMKEAEARLMALQKISTIDHMSSMIAHELPQPLGAVQAYAEGLLRAQNKQALDSQTLTEMLIKIIFQTKKVEDIVNSVRNYAKERKLKKTPSKVNGTVAEAIQDFRFAFHCDNLAINFFRSNAEPVCSLSPLEFELAIYNLLKNAKEALEAQNVKNPEITLAVNEDKDSCRIAIADNGSKVSDDELQRIQVSMSSRKSAGLGIGLSIVRSIIQNHGGKFSIKRTELGSGITCEITLPLFKAEHSQEIKPDRTIEAHTK